jgi:hypothetical protein
MEQNLWIFVELVIVKERVEDYLLIFVEKAS